MKKDTLHTINSTGFKAPKDYFKSFEDNFIPRLETKKALADIKSSGFKTPEGYLNSVEDSVLMRLNTKKETPVISLFKYKKLYYITGIAASLIMLFAIFINQPEQEQLSVEMVEHYFINSNLDTYDLAELLTDANVLEKDFVITEINYSEENLEEYLLENVDIESIIE